MVTFFMEAGSGRQVEYLDTIEEEEEVEEEEELSIILGVRRRGRGSGSLVKQSTPTLSEESRFTASLTLARMESTSSDFSLASWSRRPCPSRNTPPHKPLPSLQEVDDAPGSPDWSPPPPLASPLLRPQSEAWAVPEQHPPWFGVLNATEPGQDVSPDGTTGNLMEIWNEQNVSLRTSRGQSKIKGKARPNRRLSMRSEDGETSLLLQVKKRNRKPRNKTTMITPAIPEWLSILMHSIEEATHHELTIE